MGRGIATEILLLGGVALLAWRLRREIRLGGTTLLLLPIAIAVVAVAQRGLIATAAGPLAPLAAIVGVAAGLVVATRSFVRVEPAVGVVVVRGTWLTVALWPGAIGLYLAGRRALLWAGSPEPVERLDGLFLLGVTALLLAERGWLYSVSRQAVAPARRSR